MKQVSMCPKCGGRLVLENGLYKCEFCNGVFDVEKSDNLEEKVRSILDDIKQEKIANLRRLLWEATHEEFLNSELIIKHARGIREYLPDDFLARFFEVASGDNIKQLNDFIINEINIDEQYDYIDVIVEYLIKTIERGSYLPVNNLIEKAYKDKNLDLYSKYTNSLAEIITKIDDGTYDLNITRDVFVAYSSKDMKEVMKLVSKLEEEGLSCFVALRNLRHGRGAVDNYDSALEKAIDNSRVLVFVSSVNSRTQSCDAVSKELPYMKKRDIDRTPSEFQNDYVRIPDKYKKPRVQYLLDKSTTNTGVDRYINEIFSSHEWCYKVEDVCERVIKLKNDRIIIADEEKKREDELNALKERLLQLDKQKIINGVDINAVLHRCEILISDHDYDKASKLIDESVLNNDPENAKAYILLTVIDYKLSEETDLSTLKTPLTVNKNYNKAVKYAKGEYKEIVQGYNDSILKQNEFDRNLAKYNIGIEHIKNKKYEEAISVFSTISSFKDSLDQINICKNLIFERNLGVYNQALDDISKYQYDKGIKALTDLGDFKDSKEKLAIAKELKKKETLYASCIIDLKTSEINTYKNAISKLETIKEYRDSEEYIEKYEKRIADLEVAKKKKKIRTLVFSIVSTCVIIFGVVFAYIYVKRIVPNNNYNKAVELLSQGKYAEAKALFSEMGTFSDAQYQVDVVNAYIAFDDGDYEKGIDYIYNAGGTINITYDANGGELVNQTQTIKKLSYVNNKVTRPGYTFYGWELTSYNIDNMKDNISADITLKASYDIIAYDITYYEYGGISTDAFTRSYTINDEVKLPVLTKIGYDFIGWVESTSQELIDDNVIAKGNYGNLTLIAYYEAKHYTITFDSDGGVIGSDVLDVIYDSEIILPLPVKIGCSFDGWYLGDKPFNKDVWNIDENISLKAKWNITIFNISYDLEDNTFLELLPNSITYFNSVKIDRLNKTGYTFLGWIDKSTNQILENDTIPEGSLRDYELVPVFEPKSYKITFDAAGGTVAQSEINVSFGSNYTLPQAEKSGYLFYGWYTTDTNVKIEDSIWSFDKDLSLKAKWTTAIYNISYDLDGGSANSKTTYITEESLTLVNPTKTGYTFIGWTGTGINENTMIVEIPLGSTGNRSYKAHYAPVVYNITYILNGGVAVNKESYTIEDDFTLAFPSKEGYDFVGWTLKNTTNVTKNVRINGLTGDLEFTANYSPKTYKISYDACGGTTSTTSVNVSYDSSYVLATSSRDYYSFDGWYLNNELVEDGIYKYTNDIELVAKWTPVDYDIIYNLNGGSLGDGSVTTYNILSNDINLVNPTKEGYVFIGWFGSSDFSGDAITKVASGSHGEKNFYACYGRVISFNSNGGEEIESAIYRKGSTVTLPTTAKDDYEFIGWYYNDKKIESGTWSFDEIITLEAKWSSKISDFTYENNENGKTVVSYNGNDIDVIIPKKVDGVIINNIKSNCFKDNKTITSITLPTEIRTIGSDAFKNCPNLDKVFVSSIESWLKISFNNEYSTPLVNDGTLYINSEVLTNLQVPSSITAIGNYAFCHVKTLESVNFHNNITQIEMYAFKDCQSLEEVILPNGIKNLSSHIFDECIDLNSVTLPNALEVIGSFAFHNCRSLESIDIPSTVTKIDNYAFENCISLTEIVIPDSVTTMGYYGVFRGCTSLRKAVLPSGISTIGEDMFKNNTSLLSIVIPDNVTSIENGAFSNCTSLLKVTIGAKVNSIYYNVTVATPEDHAFGGNKVVEVINKSKMSITQFFTTANNRVTSEEYSKLVENEDGLYIYTSNSSVDFVGGYVDNPYLVIPNGITRLRIRALVGSENVVSIEIPSTVDSAESYTFSCLCEIINHSNYNIGAYLKSVDSNLYVISNKDDTKLSKINDFIIYDNEDLVSVVRYVGKDLEVVVPNNVNDIGENAFSYNRKIKSIIIPSGVTKIKKYAFTNCSNLKNISLPSSIIEIGSSVFDGCYSLIKNEYDNLCYLGNDENPYYLLISPKDTAITETVVHDNCEIIYSSGLKNCSSLQKVTIPSNVKVIYSNAFYGCNAITEVHIDDIKSWLGIAFSGVTSNPLNQGSNLYCGDNLVESITIDSNIGDCAFCGCTSLTSVEVTNSATSIGKYAFYGCINLSNIDISSAVSTIGTYAFSGCTSLVSIVIPDAVTLLDSYVFSKCTNLSSVTLSNNLTKINNYAFSDCTSLQEITIPSSVNSIVGSPFPSSLKRVNITSIESWFKIYFGSYTSNPVYYARNLYLNDELVTNIDIPNTITYINNYALVGLESLTSITIPNSVFSIGERAFQSTKITNITIPGNVVSVGKNAFNSCISLASVTMEEGVISIEQNAFYQCSALTSIVIPNSVKTIGAEMLYGCTALEELTVPFIGSKEYKNGDAYQYPLGWFFGTSSPTTDNLVLATTQQYTGNNKTVSATYYLPKSLRKVVITKTNYLQMGAFYNCTAVTSVILPEGITISSDVFYNCPATVSYCSTRTFNSNIYKLIWQIPANFTLSFDNIPEGMDNNYLPIVSRNMYKFNGWKNSEDHFITNGSGLIDTNYLTSEEIILTPSYEEYSINPSINGSAYNFDLDALNAYKGNGYNTVRVTCAVVNVITAGYTENIYFNFKYGVGDTATTYVRIDIYGVNTGEVEPGEGDIYIYNGSVSFDVSINDLINNNLHQLMITRTDYYSAFPFTITFNAIQ